jgi:hypothetical protein
MSEQQEWIRVMHNANDGDNDQRAAWLLENADAIDTLARDHERLKEDMVALLECRPDANGNYLHLGYCNGDRRQPPGVTGHSCCCQPGGVRIRNERDALLTALRALRDKWLSDALRAEMSKHAGWMTHYRALTGCADEITSLLPEDQR